MDLPPEITTNVDKNTPIIGNQRDASKWGTKE